MSPENGENSPESDTVTGLNLEETKLTLGLPGTKRGFSQTIDLNIGSETASNQKNVDHGMDKTDDGSNDTKSTRAKAQVVGWPPVRASRRIVGGKFVKVAVDGAPYLRKVDLQKYNSYQQLLSALEEMFSCITLCNDLNERKLMDSINGVEYMPTYEDKDGDWMLVGDVPWKMFVESCKRLRLMKSSEVIGLAPKTPPKWTSKIETKKKPF